SDFLLAVFIPHKTANNHSIVQRYRFFHHSVFIEYDVSNLTILGERKLSYFQYRHNHYRNIVPPCHTYYWPMWQSVPPVNPMPQMPNRCITQAEVDYRNDMRSLWEEH